MDQNVPTILVKKSDGTFVRMPLSDFQNSQKIPVQTTQKAEPVKDIKSPKVDVKSDINISKTEIKPKIESKKITDINLDIKSTIAKREEAISNDHYKSLLDEPVPARSAMPLSSQNREKQVDEVVNSLSFKAPVGNNNRLRTIIQLYLKDIRTEQQTREVLMRKEIEGGVGLSEKQASEVIVTANQKNNPEPVKNIAPLKSALIQPSKKENARLEKESPTIREAAPFPATSSPNNAFIHPVKQETKKEMPPKPMDGRKALEEMATRISLSEAPIPEFKIKTDRAKTMNDVSAIPVEVGPVDEIRYFTLVDFRRLSANPMEAAARLKQKFLNLKDESILLFFDAFDAWRLSPLYLDYIGMVSEALAKRETIGKLAADKKRIQPAEINALLQIERELM